MTAATPLRIWVDNREKLPWEFPGCEVVSATLWAGDYSVEGLTDRVAIERKSPDDFTSTLTHGRERFEDELAKLKTYERKLIIVELPYHEIAEGLYRSKAHQNALIASIASFHAEYDVPTLPIRGRHHAQRHALLWLTKCAKHLAHLRKESAA